MRLKSVLTLCRVSNLPTVWMNVITASVLTNAASDWPFNGFTLAIIALAMSAFYCGGMALNDVCDFKWDQQHQPYRPLVMGKLSLTQAGWITFLLFAIGFMLLSFAPNVSGVISAIALFAVITGYNLWHKQHASSVFLMAGARALVFVVTALALSGKLSGWVIAAAILQFIYTLSLTLVGRHESKRGKPYSGPVIPRMIAAMAILDGLVLSIAVTPFWLLVGVAIAWLTRFGQRYVRGD